MSFNTDGSRWNHYWRGNGLWCDKSPRISFWALPIGGICFIAGFIGPPADWPGATRIRCCIFMSGPGVLVDHLGSCAPSALSGVVVHRRLTNRWSEPLTGETIFCGFRSIKSASPLGFVSGRWISVSRPHDRSLREPTHDRWCPPPHSTSKVQPPSSPCAYIGSHSCLTDHGLELGR